MAREQPTTVTARSNTQETGTRAVPMVSESGQAQGQAQGPFQGQVNSRSKQLELTLYSLLLHTTHLPIKLCHSTDTLTF